MSYRVPVARVSARLAAVAAAAAVILVGAGSASAAESLSASPSIIDPSGQLSISGAEWTCAGDVIVSVGPSGGPVSPVATIAFGDRDPSGGFTLDVTAPSSPGDYAVTASYSASSASAGCVASASDPFTVRSDATTSSTLAPTTTTTTTTVAATTTTTTLVSQDSPTTTTATTTVATTDPQQVTTTLVSQDLPTTTSGSSGPTPNLPRTGSGDHVATWAVLLLALGGLLITLARRPAA